MAAFFISHSSADQAVVERLRDRLREWGYGSMFLDFDPEDGIAVGREWERELYRQLHAADAVVFVGSRASVASQWCFAELTLARSARKPIFPVAIEPDVCMSLLDDRQWLQLTDDEVAVGRLERALRERFDPRDALGWDASRPPYPGLFAFQARDAGVFFGRDEEVAEVLGHLDATLGRGRCVAVIGASGSGKSSLVRAGVLPRLMGAGERWVVLPPFTPGERPVAAFARALAAAARERGSGVDRESLQRRLEREPASVIEVLADLAAGEDGSQPSVLVVVDQAEELVVQAAASERERFVALLQAAIGSSLPVWVLATLRSEFLSASLRDAGLVRVIKDTVLVGPLDRGRLPQVILGPARRAGLEFSPGLVERMVADTHGGDALPLLAYTLRELYDRERPDQGVITDADYDAIDGVEGALRRRADLVMRELSDRGVAERALPTLLRLVTMNAEGEPARRRVARSALDEDEFEVVQAFVDARLLVIRRRGGQSAGAAPVGEDAVVEVAHEALLRAWEPLREAVHAAQERLQFEAELARDAERWDEQGRAESYLLRGERLARARRLLASLAGGGERLAAGDREFVAASEQLERRERAAADRRRRRTIIALSVTLVLISAAALVSLWQYRDARDQAALARHRARVTDSQRLAALADAERSPDKAALLGLEAYRAAPTYEARNVILTLLPRLARAAGALVGHTRPVYAVTFSPDGHTLASAGEDGTVRLWNTRTRRPRGTPINAHTGGARTVAFSPDGRMLASAGDDGKVRLWDALTRRRLGGPLPGTGPVQTVAFSPDGRTLASAGQEGSSVDPPAGGAVRLWDAHTGRSLGTPLKTDTRLESTVAFSPDGRTLASAGVKGTVQLWDARARRPRRTTLNADAEGVDALAFSPDGRTLATASTFDGTVQLWDMHSRRPRSRLLQGHTFGVNAVAFNPDGRTLATAGDDGTVRLWDARTRRPIGTALRGGAGRVFAVAFSPDGRTLASAGEDGTVWLLSVRARHALGTPLEGRGDLDTSVAFSPDRHTLATASALDGTVQLWDMRARRPLGTPLRTHSFGVNAVAFSPDGRTLASADDDGTAKLWDTRARRLLGTLRNTHTDNLLAVAFRPDGRTLASAGRDGTVRLWDARTGRPLGTPLDAHTGGASTVAFSPNGRIFASPGSRHGTVRLWDTRTRRALGTPLATHGGTVSALAFSSDGRTMASAGNGGTVQLWDARTRRPLGTPLETHAGTVNAVAFSPDGRTLAFADEDGTVQLWDARARRALGIPRKIGAGAVSAVAFSPTGRMLASGGDEDTERVQLWDDVLWSDRWQQLRDRVCEAVRHNLSLSDWRNLLPGQPRHRTCP